MFLMVHVHCVDSENNACREFIYIWCISRIRNCKVDNCLINVYRYVLPMVFRFNDAVLL